MTLRLVPPGLPMVTVNSDPGFTTLSYMVLNCAALNALSCTFARLSRPMPCVLISALSSMAAGGETAVLDLVPYVVPPAVTFAMAPRPTIPVADLRVMLAAAGLMKKLITSPLLLLPTNHCRTVPDQVCEAERLQVPVAYLCLND